MAHDDFMYQGQEQPREAFVADLKNKLEHIEQNSSIVSPVWKRLVSIVAITLTFSAALLTISPEVRAFVVEALGINDWIAVSEEEAQEYFPFSVPQAIPEGYERQVIWSDPTGNEQEGDVVVSTFGNEHLLAHIHWDNNNLNCTITLTVLEDLNSPEMRERSFEQTEYFAERYDWIRIFDVDGVRGIWRLKTSPGLEVAHMNIEWTSLDNVLHRLETSTSCMAEDDFIALAQSSE